MTRPRARAGSRRTLAGLRFQGFPADGALWWLRWVDYDSSGGLTGSSLLRVVLSKLPPGIREDDLPVLDADLACARGATVQVRAHVGWLPVLTIGLVVRDGTVVGQLGAEVRTFALDHRLHSAAVERLRAGTEDGRTVVDRARRWRAAGGFRGVGAPLPDLPGMLADPLPGLVDGRVLSLAPRKPSAGLPHLVLPCPEVLRVAYAPHSELARAILDGPWEGNRHDVLDVGRTAAADGGWTVVTRRGLREEHVATAGNLCLNPVAARNANLVRAAILSRPDGPASIAAPLPFEWTTLELRVAAFRVPGAADLWFGYEILGMGWPDPPRGPPSVIRWISPRPRGQDGAPAGGLPPPGSPATAAPEGGIVDVTRGLDAGPGPGTDVAEPGAAWMNRPEVVRLPADDPPPPGPGPRRPTEPVGVDALSAGADARGPTGAAPAAVRAAGPRGSDEPLSVPFAEVLAMLDGLVADRVIISHEAVDPPPRSAVRRGDVACWAFPAVPALTKGAGNPARNWYVRDFRVRGSTTPRVIRAAMVRRIVHADGFAYLLEIEPRPHASKREASRTLAFAPAAPVRLQAVVSRLLVVAAEREGVWPDGGELAGLTQIGEAPGIVASATWAHHRGAKAGAAGSGPRLLAGAPARDAIKRVVSILATLG